MVVRLVSHVCIWTWFVKLLYLNLVCKKFVLYYVVFLYFQVFIVLVPSTSAFAWDYRCYFDRAVG